MPDPTRKYAYASVRVYDRGHGDPLCIDRGLGWYSVLSKDWESGLFSLNTAGRRYLQCFPETGLIHRAFLVQQDTRLSQVTTSGGAWEEDRNSVGGRRVYKLTQYDGTATATSWSATTTYQRPLNAAVAFSVKLPDTGSDWDGTTYPPFFQIEINPTWGIEFVKDGVFLVRYVSGSWQAVADLPSPPQSSGFADEREIWIFARVEEGQLGVSFDFGNSYTWYAPPGETVTLAAGKITFRGRGTCPTVGIHQLRLYTGTLDSYGKELELPRAGWTASFAKSRYTAPLGTGGSVAFTDLGTPLARLAKYRVTLTPGSQSGTPFTWYFGGAVRAVHYRVPPVVQTTGNSWSTPFDAVLRSGRITKPFELAGTNASFSFWADAFTENDFDGYRWRRMEIWLGWRLTDDTLVKYQAFTGYVAGWEASWNEQFGKVLVTFHLHNPSVRLQRCPWTPFVQLPLAGQTPNAASLEILEAYGLNASYASFHPWGDVGLIGAGSPEDPPELSPAEETGWETLIRIQAERDLEVGVADDGTLIFVPRRLSTGNLARTFRAGEGAADIWEQVRSMTYRTDYTESGTGALVYGTDASGRFVFRYDVDSSALTATGDARFCPWPETRQLSLSGTPDAGLVTGHCQSLAGDTFVVKREGSITIPFDPTLSRRDEVELVGFAGAGVPDHTRFVMTTLGTEFDLTKGYTELTTEIGLARVI